jgi:hypothetical protein
MTRNAHLKPDAKAVSIAMAEAAVPSLNPLLPGYNPLKSIFILLACHQVTLEKRDYCNRYAWDFSQAFTIGIKFYPRFRGTTRIDQAKSNLGKRCFR